MTMALNRRTVLAGLAALPACRASGTAHDAEVIVLGAGLSGLNAARILAADGKDVLVLEGSSRIGGRLQTFDHGELGFTEGGGEQIGASYARIIDIAHDVGVELVDENVSPRSVTYYYQDKTFHSDAVKDLKPFPFPDAFKGMQPGAPLFSLAARANPLEAAIDWRDPKFSAFDISAREFLANAGFERGPLDVVNQALNANNLASYSMMNLYRTLQLYSNSRQMGASKSVKGGAHRLPIAMAASLPRPVKLERRVQKISVSADKVSVIMQDGQTYRAPNCICALPFGAFRHLKIEAPLTELQRGAMKSLPYTQILQIHMHSKTRFWEKDGLPADMWTDQPVERLFAHRTVEGDPTGLFRIWINGQGASNPIWKNRSNIAEVVKNYMRKVRPASEGAFDILAVADWTRDNPLAGGAYMHWAPGQIKRWAGKMRAPAGRLSFAGEHLSHLHTGMEGAMESGEIAAFDLMGL